MLAAEPDNRLNMKGIKSHPWYNKEYASESEMKKELSRRLEDEIEDLETFDTEEECNAK